MAYQQSGYQATYHPASFVAELEAGDRRNDSAMISGHGPVFEMSAESAATPKEQVQRPPVRTPEEEPPRQANPWPFYLEESNSKQAVPDNKAPQPAGPASPTESAPAPANPWPYHGPADHDEAAAHGPKPPSRPLREGNIGDTASQSEDDDDLAAEIYGIYEQIPDSTPTGDDTIVPSPLKQQVAPTSDGHHVGSDEDSPQPQLYPAPLNVARPYAKMPSPTKYMPYSPPPSHDPPSAEALSSPSSPELQTGGPTTLLYRPYRPPSATPPTQSPTAPPDALSSPSAPAERQRRYTSGTAPHHFYMPGMRPFSPPAHPHSATTSPSAPATRPSPSPQPSPLGSPAIGGSYAVAKIPYSSPASPPVPDHPEPMKNALERPSYPPAPANAGIPSVQPQHSGHTQPQAPIYPPPPPASAPPQATGYAIPGVITETPVQHGYNIPQPTYASSMSSPAQPTSPYQQPQSHSSSPGPQTQYSSTDPSSPTKPSMQSPPPPYSYFASQTPGLPATAGGHPSPHLPPRPGDIPTSPLHHYQSQYPAQPVYSPSPAQGPSYTPQQPPRPQQSPQPQYPSQPIYAQSHGQGESQGGYQGYQGYQTPPLPPRPPMGQSQYAPLPAGFSGAVPNAANFPPPPKTHYVPPPPSPAGANRPGSSKYFNSSATKWLNKTGQVLGSSLAPMLQGQPDSGAQQNQGARAQASPPLPGRHHSQVGPQSRGVHQNYNSRSGTPGTGRGG